MSESDDEPKKLRIEFSINGRIDMSSPSNEDKSEPPSAGTNPKPLPDLPKLGESSKEALGVPADPTKKVEEISSGDEENRDAQLSEEDYQATFNQILEEGGYANLGELIGQTEFGSPECLKHRREIAAKLLDIHFRGLGKTLRARDYIDLLSIREDMPTSAEKDRSIRRGIEQLETNEGRLERIGYY